MELRRHALRGRWVLWAHLPNVDKWSLDSYIKLLTLTTVEESIAIMEALPTVVIETCMLFLMREGITPIWEDPRNASGGCFSYKVMDGSGISRAWKEMCYSACGETLSEREPRFNDIVNGITISRKKTFCIIKIWTSTDRYQDPTIVTNKLTLCPAKGCLFKRHAE